MAVLVVAAVATVPASMVGHRVAAATPAVPVDYAGRVPGTLGLQVAMANDVRAPKGVLLFLTGGPGEAAVPFADGIAHSRLPELAADYRFVFVDQRGTGELLTHKRNWPRGHGGGATLGATSVKGSSMNGSYEVATTSLSDHAGTLSDLATQLNSALSAATVTIAGDAYGQTAGPIATSLGNAGKAGQDTLQAGITALERAASALRDTVNAYQQPEDAYQQEFTRIGGQVDGITGPQFAGQNATAVVTTVDSGQAGS